MDQQINIEDSGIIPIQELHKLAIRPDEILLIKVPESWTGEQRQAVTRRLSNVVLKAVRFLIYPANIEFTIVKDTKENENG